MASEFRTTAEERGIGRADDIDTLLAEVERLRIRCRLASTTLEFVRGAWVPACDAEALALVTYATNPSPETGHVGWCWWARGKMGDAPTLAAAMLAAEKNLEGGTWSSLRAAQSKFRGIT